MHEASMQPMVVAVATPRQVCVRVCMRLFDTRVWACACVIHGGGEVGVRLTGAATALPRLKAPSPALRRSVCVCVCV